MDEAATKDALFPFVSMGTATNGVEDMPARYESDTVILSGQCGVGEVDELVPFLDQHPQAVVSLDGRQRMHTAVFQLLLRRGVRAVGTPEDTFISRWLYPLLSRGEASVARS